VHLIGFIIRIYHDAQSSDCLIAQYYHTTFVSPIMADIFRDIVL